MSEHEQWAHPAQEEPLPDLSQEVTIRIKLGFLLTILGTVVGIVLVFASMKSDVLSMLRTVDSHTRALEDNQHTIMDLQLHLRTIDSNVQYLREGYERDVFRRQK